MNKMDIWSYLKNVDCPIALYGMGNGAQAVLNRLEKNDVQVVGIFASNGFVRGQHFRGYRVSSYEELYTQYPEMLILVCFGTSRPDVLEYITYLSTRHEVLCPDVPVYGENIFDADFYKQHKDEIDQVYSMLEDDYSRETYQKIVEFKLSGRTELLQSCAMRGNVFSPLNLGPFEHYVDLGAYRGDTVDEFLSSVAAYQSICAFEPNPANYRKLCDHLVDMKDAKAVWAAASDCDGVAQIFLAGRGSSLKQKGTEVPKIALDTFFANRQTTLIKIDVEGQERDVLLGAQEVVRRDKPKIVVAAYHRSEDIFALPLLVHDIRPDYKILMRHFPHNLAWDTNFYFI